MPPQQAGHLLDLVDGRLDFGAHVFGLGAAEAVT
jgi:hypothetical protein